MHDWINARPESLVSLKHWRFPAFSVIAGCFKSSESFWVNTQHRCFFKTSDAPARHNQKQKYAQSFAHTAAGINKSLFPIFRSSMQVITDNPYVPGMAHVSHLLSIRTLCLYAHFNTRWVWLSRLSVNVSSLGVSSYSDIWLPICVELPCRSTLMETFCRAINCGGTSAAKMWAKQRRATHRPATLQAKQRNNLSKFLLFLPFLREKIKYEERPVAAWEARDSSWESVETERTQGTMMHVGLHCFKLFSAQILSWI